MKSKSNTIKAKDGNYDMAAYIAKLKECQATMSASLEIITPIMAGRWLSKNLGKTPEENPIKNRKLDERVVAKYIDDMKNGRWEVALPILFDDKGNMIDGQSRCSGVFRSGVPIISWVIRGISRDAFSVIDIGKKRNLGDTLSTLIIMDANGKTLSLTRPKIVGSAIMMMGAAERNYRHIDKEWRVFTVPEIIEMVKNDFDFYEAPFKGGLKSKILIWNKRINQAIAPNILAAFYYTHKKADGDQVDKFLDILTSNDNNTYDVVRTFRDIVIESKNRLSNNYRRYLMPAEKMEKMELLYSLYKDDKIARKSSKTLLLKKK